MEQSSIKYCYFYSIRQEPYKNNWNSGWIDAYNINEAIEKLMHKYGPFKDLKHDLKVTKQGTWKDFININNRLGWD